MPPDSLKPIRDALKAGNKQGAQTLLKPLLKNQPTPEVWYLAAQACTTDEKAIFCLRNALDLQPQHSGANRLLFKLEGAKPAAIEELPPVEVLVDLPLKPVKRRKKGRTTRILVLLCLLVFGTSCSLITMNLIGVISGPVTVVTELTGGATPVREIEGKPLSQVTNAPLLVTPSMTKPLNERDANVLEPGYAHDYTFEGRNGTDAAIYVQFLSLGANRVSRNVVVLRPDGSNATPNCERDSILQGDNNITLMCSIDANGLWEVRILGREGESVGAYFVGVEQMQR